MKPFIAGIAALLILGSCSLPFGEAGSLKIALQGVQARAAVVAGDPVRIQVLRNGRPVNLSGKAYLEEKAAGQTIVIDGLPAGSGYEVLVTAGKYEEGFFVASQFGRSGTFEIVAGVDTAKSVEPTHSNQVLLAGSGGLDGAVAAVGSDLYYLSTTGIRSKVGQTTWTLGGLGSAAVNSLGTGYNYKSAQGTVGAERLMINTTQGLSYLSGSGVTAPGIPQYDGKATTFLHPNITFSSGGKFYSVADTKNFYFSLYSGAGLTAGAYAAEENSAAVEDWGDLESGIGDLDESIRKTLEASGSVIRGVSFSDEFAHVSTAAGAYRITTKMVTKGTDKFGEYFSADHPEWTPLDDNHDSLEMLIDAKLPVEPIASAISDTSGQGSGLVFLGTYKGLYAGPINKLGVLTAGPTQAYTARWEEVNNGVTTLQKVDKTAFKATLVPGTENRDIVRLASTVFGGVIYTAAYAADTAELSVFQGRDLYQKVPSFAGLPSGVPELAWYKEGGSLKLAIAGANGSVLWTVIP